MIRGKVGCRECDVDCIVCRCGVLRLPGVHDGGRICRQRSLRPPQFMVMGRTSWNILQRRQIDNYEGQGHDNNHEGRGSEIDYEGRGSEIDYEGSEIDHEGQGHGFNSNCASVLRRVTLKVPPPVSIQTLGADHGNPKGLLHCRVLENKGRLQCVVW